MRVLGNRILTLGQHIALFTLPPMFAKYAIPTPQNELFATAAITPAQLLPWLKGKKKQLNLAIYHTHFMKSF